MNLETFSKFIVELKNKSPLYPEVIFEEKEEELWCSTIVIFERSKRKYKRHHARSIIPNGVVNKNNLEKKLRNDCQMTIEHGFPIYSDLEIFDDDI